MRIDAVNLRDRFIVTADNLVLPIIQLLDAELEPTEDLAEAVMFVFVGPNGFDHGEIGDYGERTVH